MPGRARVRSGRHPRQPARLHRACKLCARQSHDVAATQTFQDDVVDTSPTGHGHVPAPIGPYHGQQAEQHTAHARLARPAPVGRVRGTGACIALAIVTLGFYSLYWFDKTHQEMKNHAGTGMGGGVALVLAFFIGMVMPFVTSGEVRDLYRRAGMARPVSGATGLWYFPGMFILIGPLVWFIKTNSALNSYWRSHGAE